MIILSRGIIIAEEPYNVPERPGSSKAIFNIEKKSEIHESYHKFNKCIFPKKRFPLQNLRWLPQAEHAGTIAVLPENSIAALHTSPFLTEVPTPGSKLWV